MIFNIREKNITVKYLHVKVHVHLLVLCLLGSRDWANGLCN